MKRGGHFKRIKLVKHVERCRIERVRVAPHRWRRERIGRAPRASLTTTLRVPYGHGVTIDGRYNTGEGMPLPGQRVQIFAAPNNTTGAFSQIAAVTTGSNGSWTASSPPAPSEIIRAVTNGTATILPSSGQVTTIVPADVRLLRVWPHPRGVGWHVHMVGQLLGGYLPPGGALVRLRIGIGSARTTTACWST